MNTIVEMLASHSMFENERTSLDAFYQAMIERIEAVHTLRASRRSCARFMTVSSLKLSQA